MEALPTEDRMTGRSIAKASRRAALLDAAAHLFAVRGYNGVSIEDLGAAAGVSGPAVYRHFAGKPSVLSSLLTGVSEDLLEGGRAVAAAAVTPEDALRALIRFQVEFAVSHADVIRVQDRDLGSLPDEDERTVRSLQRSYVQVWIDELAAFQPDSERPLLRRRVHAVFGLINSTPHTAHGTGPGSDLAALRELLEDMAWAALTV
ncbi:TetR/AcrR family transcriptional regulator [Arthrobacter agilis]|uniref:TetR/AcrR family transcriptional regulator n=1 Tax=Arthrobacter agilis TaxID=37921 RepID=UPI000B3542CD|nr:TetR family transcriptional regulator [Arthrobacter agilis]OUM40387.1 TetR family transcriptional regulator [Arthrobacter agilis]PPB45002.1 TetR/AcrR family transcriptional regulator [Arthrobacter agilis]TPV27705.1 TetR/AcrR family transcriptional regulator [Arthrobacter agilis]VDR31655.1 HTH-type transcriptional repressor KstR2 [Arthrobacter agilis]